MKKKRLPKSIRKFIRLEKAHIRRGVLTLNQQGELINKLYQGLNRDDSKRDLQSNNK